MSSEPPEGNRGGTPDDSGELFSQIPFKQAEMLHLLALDLPYAEPLVYVDRTIHTEGKEMLGRTVVNILIHQLDPEIPEARTTIIHETRDSNFRRTAPTELLVLDKHMGVALIADCEQVMRTPEGKLEPEWVEGDDHRLDHWVNVLRSGAYTSEPDLKPPDTQKMHRCAEFVRAINTMMPPGHFTIKAPMPQEQTGADIFPFYLESFPTDNGRGVGVRYSWDTEDGQYIERQILPYHAGHGSPGFMLRAMDLMYEKNEDGNTHSPLHASWPRPFGQAELDRLETALSGIDGSTSVALQNLEESRKPESEATTEYSTMAELSAAFIERHDDRRRRYQSLNEGSERPTADSLQNLLLAAELHLMAAGRLSPEQNTPLTGSNITTPDLHLFDQQGPARVKITKFSQEDCALHIYVDWQPLPGQVTSASLILRTDGETIHAHYRPPSIRSSESPPELSPDLYKAYSLLGEGFAAQALFNKVEQPADQITVNSLTKLIREATPA